MVPRNLTPPTPRNQPYRHELAQLYDVAVPDWPGELAFYRQLAASTPKEAPSILELACGTGRIAIPLARSGFQVVGLDLSEEMLELARAKSNERLDVRWIRGDMRTFELRERYGLALVPAYSFQLLLTAAHRASCLRQLAKHLVPGAQLVLHLETHDPEWVASLPVGDSTPFAPSGTASHPATGQRIRVSYAWSRNETASHLSVKTRYEVLSPFGRVKRTHIRGPLVISHTDQHELEDLLRRSGFQTVARYGDFNAAPFRDDAEELIWVARKPGLTGSAP